MLHSILAPLADYAPILYVAIFLGMILEGEAVVFAAMLLMHQRVLSWTGGSIVVVTGLLSGDMLWYIAGRSYLHKLPFLARIAHRVTRAFDRQLLRKPFRIIALSKFTYGIHHAILLRAGTLKIDKKRFVRMIVAANIIWLTVIGSIGYLLSASLATLRFRHYIRYAELLVLAGILGFFFIERLIGTLSETVLSGEVVDGEKED